LKRNGTGLAFQRTHKFARVRLGGSTALPFHPNSGPKLSWRIGQRQNARGWVAIAVSGVPAHEIRQRAKRDSPANTQRDRVVLLASCACYSPLGRRGYHRPSDFFFLANAVHYKAATARLRLRQRVCRDAVAAGACGLPRTFPLARAFRRPARTRSWISERSNSAMAPII
jgi:hypothetical protein